MRTYGSGHNDMNSYIYNIHTCVYACMFAPV